MDSAGGHEVQHLIVWEDPRMINFVEIIIKVIHGESSMVLIRQNPQLFNLDQAMPNGEWHQRVERLFNRVRFPSMIECYNGERSWYLIIPDKYILNDISYMYALIWQDF